MDGKEESKEAKAEDDLDNNVDESVLKKLDDDIDNIDVPVFQAEDSQHF